MDKRSLPVAVFDSGVGGISVLRELTAQMPAERFLYYGDTANAPYGGRPQEEVCGLTVRAFASLREEGFKAIVVACNTATGAAIAELRREYAGMPVIGIEPALKPAADRFPGGTVLVLATETTLREAKFAALTARCSSCCAVLKLACPGLMEFVERGETDGSELREYLTALLSGTDCAAVDAVVLGCTHYPFVRSALRKYFPEKTVFFDGSAGTARETARRLKQAGLLRSGGKGGVEFRCSGDAASFTEKCVRLLNTDEE